MRATSLVMVLVLAGTVGLCGCGKSAEQKRLEADLNSQIMKGHEVLMEKPKQAAVLLTQLDSAIAISDSLIKEHPNGTGGLTSSDLIAARDKVEGSRSALDSWMQGHTPYNEGIKHERAMAQLQTDLNALTQVGDQMDTAIVDATKAIAIHREFVSTLSAGGPKSRRK